eukprot:4187922-Ditylum_brightwellii.AAC.1
MTGARLAKVTPLHEEITEYTSSSNAEIPSSGNEQQSSFVATTDDGSKKANKKESDTAETIEHVNRKENDDAEEELSNMSHAEEEEAPTIE